MMKHLMQIKATVLAILIGLAVYFDTSKAYAADTELLTVAGGCFWCVEADFESVKGVKEVVSGFAGGDTQNPNYKQVTSGGTGHYEAVQIQFDPNIVSRETLLAKFFRSIDPTDAGGQFCDRGDSYRTAIFVKGDAEKKTAEKVKANAQALLGKEIVTPILEFSNFYPASAKHQDYYKGTKIILTRFGPKKQSKAYKAYRHACGRDARVKELWGAQAPFVGS